MVADIGEMTDIVRLDLHDDDALNERWDDETLARHIERAVLDYSHVAPIEQKTTLQTVADSREIDVSSLAPRIRIVAVEWPTTEYPRAFVPFSLWGDTLTLDLATAPTAAEDADHYWHKTHTLDVTASSVPEAHDAIIATGAAAYAALEWASYATNRVNVGGPKTWDFYMDFGRERLAAFRQQLRDLPEANRLRTGQLYTPQSARFRSETTDPGPV